MRNELYEKVAERYREKYKEIVDTTSHTIDGAFNDIARNLLEGLSAITYTFRLKLPEEREKLLKHFFVVNLKSIRDYFKLLEDFPEFKEEELFGNKGCFPDLREKIYSEEGRRESKELFGEAMAHNHYVHLAKQRLRKNEK